MIKKEIKRLIKAAIRELQMEKLFPDFEMSRIEVDSAIEDIFGDYSVNTAMRIAKEIKKSAMEVALKITEELKFLDRENRLFEKVEAVEPGFINFFVSKKNLLNFLNDFVAKGKYSFEESGKGKTIVIDYSSTNIAKSFGVGHLRSTIIGQAIYNIYKFLGWKCVGVNHLGDWGTQFGKLIRQIKVRKLVLENLTIDDLEKTYIEFHKEVKDNPEMEDEARGWFKKLEEGDEEARNIWKVCVETSLKEFERIYALLGVKIDYCMGESFYVREGKVNEIIKEAVKKKVASESQGALIIEYPDNVLPVSILLKSNKTTTYLTRDLATVKYRLKKWKPDLFIYEVGSDQSLHLKQLFLAVELLGWSKRENFFHVAHGLIRNIHGKFSTRKGETIHLENILNEAIERAEKIVRESADEQEFSEEKIKEIAKAVGIGAVKYNDLSQHYKKDIVFDWDKMLNLKGDSGPYLQYVCARTESVLRKAGGEAIFPADGGIFNKEEEVVLRTIFKFSEAVEKAAKRFSPNIICEFSFDLAQKYN
ncbi:arginine--tRNA ligase, partial [Candidatus Parcubacteria bacterium A4]